MSKRVDLLASARNVISGVFGALGYVLRFARLMFAPKAVLVAKLLAAESQFAACVDAVNRRKAPRPKFTFAFRFLWIVISKCLTGWRKLAHVMRPATVVRWHRWLARFIWRWKSKPGRPKVSRKMQGLIRKLSKENPLWGAERIREELAKLK